jgi:Signal transduction histidine kinase
MPARRASGLADGSRPRLDPLDRLRLRLTAWYVGTFAAILLVLGGGLFLAVAHQIGGELDRNLEAALVELVHSASPVSPINGSTPRALRTSPVRVPGFSLYLFDSTGRPLLADTASPLARSAARSALRSGRATVEAPTGKEHELRIRASTFRSSGGDQLTAVVAADLEDLEDRYTLLIAQFAAAAVAALALVGLGGVFLARKSARPVERAVEGMRRFMSDAGHEMRTPVTVLRTEAEVALGRARDPAEDFNAFQRIARESVRLSSVVEDLFTLARAESGELPIRRESVYLDDIVSDAVAATAALASGKGVALQLEQFEEAPVYGSAALLSRLAIILLDNAVKYTPFGGSVAVSVRASAQFAVLEVVDTGVGIAPDALPQVFDRFYRADATRRTAPGAGLGLAIARWIATAHDGVVSLSSVAGRGTAARLELPRQAR